MIRCVIIGTVAFTARCLHALIGDRSRGESYAVVGIVTGLAENSRNSDYVDLSPYAASLNCPLSRTATTRGSAVFDTIASWQPDLILVLGWSQLLDEPLLRLPKYGCIGSHPAPLPNGRGRHPLIWSMILGWPGALTLFQLETGADTGAIWSQRSFTINPDDHADAVYDAMSEVGSTMIVDLLHRLAAGTATSTPQDHRKATVLRKRSAEDGILRFDRPAAECHALVRALSRPYPGAVARIAAGEIHCWRVAPLNNGRVSQQLPGSIIVCDSQMIEIACADQTLVITETTGPRPRIGDCCHWPSPPSQQPYKSVL